MANEKRDCATCPDAAECNDGRVQYLTHKILEVVATIAEGLDLEPEEAMRCMVHATAILATATMGGELGPAESVVMRLQRVDGDDDEMEVADATLH